MHYPQTSKLSQSFQIRYIFTQFYPLIFPKSQKYKPCETVFISCNFRKLTIEGMRAQTNTRNTVIRQRIKALWDFPEIDYLDSARLSVLFEDCKFIAPNFKNCYFESISFASSEVYEPKVTGCSFDGISGEKKWWKDYGSRRPLEAYQAELIEEIRNKIGDKSWTYKKILECSKRFDKKEFSLNWSEYIIEGGIPDDEYEILETIMDDLAQKHPS